MTWFTLGNISVVGTYYTHVLNLTPRGLLAVTAAASLLSCRCCQLYRTVRLSRRDGSSFGSWRLLIYSPYRINKCSLQLASFTARGLSSRPALSFTARSFSQLAASRSCNSLRIFSANCYNTVTIIRSFQLDTLITVAYFKGIS